LKSQCFYYFYRENIALEKASIESEKNKLEENDKNDIELQKLKLLEIMVLSI
jgi:hypothetical protein